MPNFHSLTVKDIKRETPECVSIAFDIPNNLKDDFQYKQGQYITLKFDINGEELRRSYSVCSCPLNGESLRIAVKEVEEGRVSGFLNNKLATGQEVDVMKPMGNFYTEMPASSPQHYVAFAAGSGITPVMSLLKTALQSHPENKFTLFYGNRTHDQIIFKDELNELIAQNENRFNVHHILSRQETGDPLFTGRISPEKTVDLMTRFDEVKEADEFFLCGPFDMTMGIKGRLIDMGVPKEKVHFELFTTEAPDDKEEKAAGSGAEEGGDFTNTRATIMLDGEEVEIDVPKGESVLDSVLDAGLDAPYACTGGSCSTCRAKLMKGNVEMEVNYALTDEEVEEGYILTCQSHPTTAEIEVDYDEP